MSISLSFFLTSILFDAVAWQECPVLRGVGVGYCQILWRHSISVPLTRISIIGVFQYVNSQLNSNFLWFVTIPADDIPHLIASSNKFQYAQKDIRRLSFVFIVISVSCRHFPESSESVAWSVLLFFYTLKRASLFPSWCKVMRDPTAFTLDFFSSTSAEWAFSIIWIGGVSIKRFCAGQNCGTLQTSLSKLRL